MVLVMAGYLAFLKDPSVLSKPVMWHVWPCCSEQTGVPLFWPGPMHSLHTQVSIYWQTLMAYSSTLLCWEISSNFYASSYSSSCGTPLPQSFRTFVACQSYIPKHPTFLQPQNTNRKHTTILSSP